MSQGATGGGRCRLQLLRHANQAATPHQQQDRWQRTSCGSSPQNTSTLPSLPQCPSLEHHVRHVQHEALADAARRVVHCVLIPR